MNFVRRLIRSLTLPNNAGPNDPAIVIGPDIPPELQAFYTGVGISLIAALIFRTDANEYDYIALGDEGGIPHLLTGTCDAGTIFHITDQVTAGIGVLSVGTISPFAAFQLGGTFNIDGVAQGRGLKTQVRSAASSAAVGAETVVLTTSVATFKANRVYRATWRGLLTASAAQTTTARIRKTNVAGQNLGGDWQQTVVAGALSGARTDETYFRVGGADVVAAICLTLQASAGTITQTASATNVRYLTVSDVADPSTYGSIVTLV